VKSNLESCSTSFLKTNAALGYYNAYALIALPNEASIALHTSLGFQLVGVLKGIGYKLDSWRFGVDYLGFRVDQLNTSI